MNKINVKLCEITTRVIAIGFEGENNHTQVAFDCSPVFADYPNAVASLAVKPPVGSIYPKVVTKSGNEVLWDVSASDCAYDGSGEYQLTFTNGEEIIKTWTGNMRVYASLLTNGNPPTPIEDWLEAANAVLGALEDMTASASGLPAGSDPTAEMTEVGGHKNIAIGIPAGAKGDPGTPGTDGVSPVITVTDITGGHRITIVDAEGTHTVDVMNGEDGNPGTPGADGYSPTVAITDITGGHTVTITDKGGAHAFNVMDGTPGFSPVATVTKSGTTATISITDAQGTTTAQISDGNPAELIDDTTPAANKTFSSDKLNTELSGLLNAIDVLDNSKAPIIIDSASGAIATFPDGADDLPVESMTVQIEPVQDLHGQSSPYPGGGGKNKFHFSTGRNSYTWSDGFGFNSISAGDDGVTFNGTATSGHNFSVVGASSVLPAGTYRVTTQSADVGLGILVDGSAIVSGYGTSGASFTLNAETEIAFTITVVNGASFSNTFVGFQIESGSTATAWSPYANLCPITGWTGAQITGTGINIWDGKYESGYLDVSDGTKQAGVNWGRSKNFIPCKPEEDYYFFTDYSGQYGFGALLFYDENMNYIGYRGTTTVNQVIATPSRCHFMGFYMRVERFSASNTSINYPATDHTYHAYSGNTYPVTWQTEAGTVYGGTVEVKADGSCRVTVTMASVDLGSLTWVSAEHYTPGVFATAGCPGIPTTNVTLICSKYKTGEPSASSSDFANWPDNTVHKWKTNTYVYVKSSDLQNKTVAEVKTAMSGVQLVYELATPIVYDLPSIEPIRSLLGYNALFADTGDVAVDYRADTKLFVEKTEVSGVQDVQVNGTSVVTDGVANVPLASGNNLGVVKIGNGISVNSSGSLNINNAASNLIKEGSNIYRPIVPYNQHESAFYALAKAAGADMASLSSVTVGTYPDAQLKAIRKMLGIPNQEWELIADYTVAEDTDEVVIDTDVNGQSFSLSKCSARIILTANTTEKNDYFYSQVLAKDTNNATKVCNSPVGRWPSNGVAGYCETYSELIGNYIRSEMRSGSTTEGNSQNVTSSSSLITQSLVKISGIKLSKYSSTTSQITEGTRIMLYGIRIDE